MKIHLRLRRSQFEPTPSPPTSALSTLGRLSRLERRERESEPRGGGLRGGSIYRGKRGREGERSRGGATDKGPRREIRRSLNAFAEASSRGEKTGTEILFSGVRGGLGPPGEKKPIVLARTRRRRELEMPPPSSKSSARDIFPCITRPSQTRETGARGISLCRRASDLYSTSCI